jgi:hypothetical protein
MTDYSESELRNEVSQVQRARLDPGRDGGTLNTQQEYEQLLEMSSTTLLLNKDSLFYIALLSRNRLSSLIKQEVAVAEDMLVALDELSQQGQPVTDTTTLSNAKTALLALDNAGTVANRPELDRFTTLMDKFAAEVRPNVISTTGNFVRPKENARNILLANMQKLEALHDEMLEFLFALRDVSDDYRSADIPSKAAATIFSNIRDQLDGLISDIETDSDVDNVAKSRQTLLTALSSKSSVLSVGSFSDPTELKVRTPTNPIPSTIKHLGRVTGTGVPASVLSTVGPWPVPISDTLDISINGGPTVQVDVDDSVGTTLNGSNKETFNITADNENLHVTVDPNSYTAATTSFASTTRAALDTYFPLGFKHVGCPVWFDGMDAVTPKTSDFYARIISEMRQLQACNITAAAVVNANMYQLDLGSFFAADEAASGLAAHHVGMYIKQGTNRYEILQVISSSRAIVSFTNGMSAPVIAAAELRGQTPSPLVPADKTKFSFLPATIDNANGNAIIGPAVKNAKFDVGGTRTVANLLTDILAEDGNYLAFAGMAEMQAIDRHVKATPMANDPTRLALTPRSHLNPYLAVNATFLQVQTTAAKEVYLNDSSHETLGFIDGEEAPKNLDTPLLTPDELARVVTEAVTGATAAVVVTELVTGSALETLTGTATVRDTSVDFDALVAIGDQIEIFTGTYTGVYQITNVSGSVLTLQDVSFSSSENSLSYRVFQEQVEISSPNGVDSSIEIISGPVELGYTTGINYSSIPQFEAIDRLGNSYPFTELVPGDLLRIAGSSQLIEITGVASSIISLATGLPSNLKNTGFEVQGGAAKVYDDMKVKLTTITTSPNLLKKNGFDEGVEAIDTALTAAVLPGSGFAAGRNRAKQILGELLSILTDTLLREEEYSAQIPTASLTIEGSIRSYTAPVVDSVNKLVDAFRERKYDRAAKLLRGGRISDFFATTEETGSFGGAVMSAARTVAADLPEVAVQANTVALDYTSAAQVREVPDANQDFDDVDPSLESSE